MKLTEIQIQHEREYQKEYHQTHKKTINEASKNYRQNNKDSIKEYQRNYYQTHKKTIKEASKNYSQKHKNSIKEYKKNYYQTHKKTIRNYENNHLKTDPLFRCKNIIRHLISNAIYKMGYSKKSRTELILGCSFNEFKLHIEVKFTKGMTWVNHGDWHIDHIIPLATAKTEKEVLKLNYFTNLQPLWATTRIAEKYGEIDYVGNLEKGARNVL